MTDATIKNSKFPYIVLPNLSSGDGNATVSAEASGGRHELKTTTAGVKLPRVVSSPALDNAKTNSTSPSSMSNPQPPKQLKSLNRHTAINNQFTVASTPPPAAPQISNEFQALRQEMLIAHQIQRKSHNNTSIYPFVGGDATSAESTKSVIDLRSGDAAKKLDLEALSQLFPHRSKQLKTARINLQAKSLSQLNSSRKSTPTALATARSVLEKVSSINLSPCSSTSSVQNGITASSSLSLEHLKSRVDGLTVHVKNRDCEVTKLKEHVVELQLLILKEKQETDGSNELMERLSLEMEALANKLESVETKLVQQERNILNKLLLIEEMGTSDSESEQDYGKVQCKSSNWMTNSSSSSNTTIPCKSTTNISNGAATQNNAFHSGINSLKECVNWVPIAPDFDKLLNVIALLNFRMDRNQSMQLSRNGNEVTFKHADTLPLVIYKNGLILGNTGFRSYATLSVIKLINEMFSGYFPSELHSQYPDGIVFVVSDKRSIIHELCPGFNGPGIKLSNSTLAPFLLPGAERLTVPLRKSEVSLKSNSRLSIPSCASSSDISLSPVCIILPELNNKLGKNHNGHKIICLKLKNIATGHCFKLRLSTSTTISAVLKHLEKHLNPNLGSDGSEKFDIVLPLPYGILTSGNSTLKDYGLVTNTLLYIQPTTEELLTSSDSSTTTTTTKEPI